MFYFLLFLKYFNVLLIMLLQLSHFPLCLPPPSLPPARIEVSRVQFYDVSSVDGIVCPPPKVRPSSITIHVSPFTLYCPNSLLPSGDHPTIVCVHKFQFYIPHMSDITWFLDFSDYFTWHSILKVHPCHCKWQCFIFSNGRVVLHHIYVPHLLYPTLCWRTLVVSMSWPPWILLQWT